jgi:hypothetical protein
MTATAIRVGSTTVERIALAYPSETPIKLALVGTVGPANALAIGTVTTGAPGSSAAAAITGTPPSQTLDLTLPRGATGPAGADGATPWVIGSGGVISYTGGVVGIGTAFPNAASKLHVQGTVATATHLVVQGVAGQSAPLQGWRNSAGTQLAYLNLDGAFITTGVLNSAGLNIDFKWQFYNAGSALLYMRDQVNGRMQFTATPGAVGLSRIDFNDRITVQAGAGQTANVFDAKSSAGVNLVSISPAGNLGIGLGATASTAPLDIAGDTHRQRTSRTPASATAAGNAGDICWDANFVYVCVATNTWKRSALATW